MRIWLTFALLSAAAGCAGSHTTGETSDAHVPAHDGGGPFLEAAAPPPHLDGLQ